MFKAFGNYIVVKATDGVEAKTTGGILLASGSLEQENSKRSEVVSVSDSLSFQASCAEYRKIQVGDIVHSKYYAGIKVYYGGESYLCLQYEDVMAVERGDADEVS